jgi:hypothetical protein
MDATPIVVLRCDLQLLEFQPVRRSAEEPLFNSIMEQHHDLGYEQPVGEHLKYLVLAKSRPIACLAWASAPRHLASRGRYIAWKAERACETFVLRAYNTRFLILPWVCGTPRLAHMGAHGPTDFGSLAEPVWASLVSGDVRECGALPRDLLSRSRLEAVGPDYGTRQAIQQLCAKPFKQGGAAHPKSFANYSADLCEVNSFVYLIE